MHIDIVFGILLTLLRHEHVTAKYLASKYEISTKTVYRYLTVLDSNNIPITSKRGKNGGIYIQNTVKMNNLFFSAGEKVALLNLTHMIDSVSLKTSIQTKLLLM